MSIFEARKFIGNKIIGITGTHGKTSTTALLSHIFHFNNVNVSYIYGGVTNFNGIGGHYGDSDQPIILETDEAFNTFEKILISNFLVLFSKTSFRFFFLISNAGIFPNKTKEYTGCQVLFLLAFFLAISVSVPICDIVDTMSKSASVKFALSE